MSKLLDLISRLGQQAAQPIGFEALAGRVEAYPAMALMGRHRHRPATATWMLSDAILWMPSPSTLTRRDPRWSPANLTT